MSASARQPEHNVNPLFIDRWSPRAFTGEAIGEQDLLTILEAGRWAPSAYNVQPWRFIYARAGTPAWGPLFATLNAFNQSWAQRASALIIVTSANESVSPGSTEAKPNPSYEFDAGAAWGYIALQTTLLGWHAHAMAGFDKDLARSSLGIPANYTVQAAVAIGRHSEDKSFLPEGLQSRDVPSPRLPVKAIAAEGRFGFEG
ncbi:MAG: malonic semialdehyde reductase RutE [Paracidovorax wautersii]|uniref:Malonic semialdehyde reductase RutE n=1 Tax=Paracidovorax wautersii TaxID=1177982 RepID=A0A7V8FN25_9BURK|nr:MAG: malonic semialdehyde reductase RutE [Paracidovorax wautersii]